MIPPLTLPVCAIAASIVAVSTLSLWPAPSAGGETARDEEGPAPARQMQLIQMVRHDCGSCHGMTLAGGLGPPLDRAAMAARPRQYLRDLILSGRPGTAMPPWRGLLNETEAAWIAARLVEGFPDAR